MKLVKSLRRLAMVAGMLELAVVCAVAQSNPDRPAGYHVADTVSLPGSGYDYMAIDPAARRLYVSTNAQEDVVDLKTNQLAGAITGLTPRNHGVAIAAPHGHGFTSSADGTSTMFDLATLKVIKTITLGVDRPDGLNYDPSTDRVFFFSHKGKAGVVDAKSGEVVGTFDLPSAEWSVPDGRGHLFVNLDASSQVAEIDARSLKIVHTWPLAPCEEPHGLAMDTKTRRLFVGCHSGILAVVNADTGAVITTFPIGKSNDATRFDPVTKNAFASNGSGTISVIHEDSPDKFTFVGNITTEPGARTMELDPVTHTLYTVTEKVVIERDAENKITGITSTPGTFHLLVIPNH